MVEPIDNERILTELGLASFAAQQQEMSPDASLTNKFTGMTIQAEGQPLKAVFTASAKAQEDGMPKVYAMSLAEINEEIGHCEDKLQNRPLVARIEKLNLPELQAAQARLTL